VLSKAGQLRGEEKRKEKGPEKWRVDHMQAFEAASLPWPPVFDADFEQKTCQLSRRGQEVAWYTEKVIGKTDEIQCLDVNMSIYYGRETEKVLPCLVSTGTVWIRGQVAGTSNQNRIRMCRVVQMQIISLNVLLPFIRRCLPVRLDSLTQNLG
jgi:hypothetical protein